MSFKTLRDFDVRGKTVLLRADLNVPVDASRNVTDTTRIDRVKPTVEYLVAQGAKTLILAHFGRPKGARNAAYSLSFLPPVLQARWGVDVVFADDCVGGPVQAMADSLKSGQVALLENVRFHAGEEQNDRVFARALAENGDIFINDAFSAAHRAHASTEGLAHLLPTGAGFLMAAELDALNAALEHPQKPVMAIAGGSKISSKLSLLKNLVKKVDYLALGGGMATTFLYAQGHEVGQSLCEPDMADEARAIMAEARACGCEILLPPDRVIVKEFGKNAPHESVSSSAIPADREAVDVGPETIRFLSGKMEGCKTVLWNGPLGVFEVTPFDTGTNELARTVAGLTKAGKIVSIAGGGDTVAALENAGVVQDFTYVSTAGGAFLEWLEGKPLPGVAALSAQPKAA
ncbi:MAG: phosphoglycerate kinase [Alphaproteobacteria bacterium]|nr:phosphoglycerate kinase [Alphaproteobacteria bacterium]